MYGDVSFSSNLETHGNHLVPGQDNIADDSFLEIQTRVKQFVQHVTYEQVHCHAKVMIPGSTFLGTSL